MSIRRSWMGMAVVGVAAVCGLVAPVARGASEQAPLVALASQALAAEPAASAGEMRAAIASLRAAGPPAVEAVVAAQRERPAPDPRFREVLDQVCAQRDCAASHLYWYTDLEQAKAEARRTGRPILTLRLLGRLDEELSCANSRYFRTVLYANAEVARTLRDHFVLHWQSVRPVPKVTIDFGDGRSLKGTITGNSIHYVLDSRGRLIDGLPGLYGPGAFLRLIATARQQAERLAALPDPAFARAAAAFHRQADARLAAELDRDLKRLGVRPEVAARARPAGRRSFVPTAQQAAALAMTKSAGESPELAALSIAGRLWETKGVDWSELADINRHPKDWELDPASRRELQRLHGGTDKQELERVTYRFEHLVGEDTVRNEFVLHVVLHGWLSGSDRLPVAEPELADLNVFNDLVYDQLFLTPSSDPWLGLASPDTYLALRPEVRMSK